jgi:hypothetical protein
MCDPKSEEVRSLDASSRPQHVGLGVASSVALINGTVDALDINIQHMPKVHPTSAAIAQIGAFVRQFFIPINSLGCLVFSRAEGIPKVGMVVSKSVLGQTSFAPSPSAVHKPTCTC